MEFKEYSDRILRLASSDLDTSRGDLIHASIGMCTEAGEFLDMVKRHIFYGKEVDGVNALEEIGDILWYMALAMRDLDITFDQVMDANILKLESRYSKGEFDETEASNRDLDTERDILHSCMAVDNAPYTCDCTESPAALFTADTFSRNPPCSCIGVNHEDH